MPHRRHYQLPLAWEADGSGGADVTTVAKGGSDGWWGCPAGAPLPPSPVVPAAVTGWRERGDASVPAAAAMAAAAVAAPVALASLSTRGGGGGGCRRRDGGVCRRRGCHGPVDGGDAAGRSPRGRRRRWRWACGGG